MTIAENTRSAASHDAMAMEYNSYLSSWSIHGEINIDSNLEHPRASLLQ